SSRKGKFAPIWRWVSARLWNRHWILDPYLAPGDTIEWRGMAGYDGRLGLVALTPSQLFVVSLSGTARQVLGVQQGSRRAVSGISQIVVDPAWWKRLIGAVPLFAVRFDIGRDERELRFFDAQTAHEFASAIALSACEQRSDGAGLAAISLASGTDDRCRRPIPA